MLTDAKLVKTGAKAAKDGPVTVTGNYSFAGHRGPIFRGGIPAGTQRRRSR